MFELCLFDLDDTLVNTSDLDEVRRSGKADASPEYLTRLDAALGDIAPRRIYSEALLNQARAAIPGLRLGVFTRAPRSYATHILGKAFPSIQWDAIVAYEDVRPTKPYGDGVHVAMRQLNVQESSSVVVVGDNDADVCAAYNAGSYVVLDKTSWQWVRRTPDHWNAMGHVPDAAITSPQQLSGVLRSPDSYLPDLESRLAGYDGAAQRFEEIGHFKPRELGGTNYPTKITVCGRSFSNHGSVARRRQGHQLTASIEANKNSTHFPDEWVETTIAFIRKRFPLLLLRGRLVITVVPHRPGRQARLEHFLTQLSQAAAQNRHLARSVSVEPDLLAYREGVRSQHNDYLNQMDRFRNVRDHLFVNRPDLVSARVSYLVIDDVTTTGASLIYADEYLRAAGATDVSCLSIAKNVGDLYWRRN